jgi:hypothetical protein
MSYGGWFIVGLIAVQLCAVVAYLGEGHKAQALFWASVVTTNIAYLWITEF